MKKPKPTRNPENTSLTISLPKVLKSRIERAAKDDRRPVSPWCVIELEKILDRIESQKTKDHQSQVPLSLVAESPNDPSSHSSDADGVRGPVKYPAGRRRKS